MKKHLFKIGLDISTKNCGYALIHNEKVELCGRVDFEIYKYPFPTFGDILCNAPLDIICATLMGKIKKILAKEYTKFSKQEQFNLFNQNIELVVGVENTIVKKNFYNASSSRKLTLFSGAIMYRIKTIINILFSGNAKTLYKFVSAQEWQIRLLDKKIGDERKELKAKSILIAKDYIQKHGDQKLLNQFWNDDMADALNIASIVDKLRDINVVKFEKNQRKKNKTLLKNNISIVENKIKKIELIAETKKIKFINKVKNAKNSKYDYEVIKNRFMIKFLNKNQLEKYNKYQGLLVVMKKQLNDIVNYSIKKENS